MSNDTARKIDITTNGTTNSAATTTSKGTTMCGEENVLLRTYQEITGASGVHASAATRAKVLSLKPTPNGHADSVCDATSALLELDYNTDQRGNSLRMMFCNDSPTATGACHISECDVLPNVFSTVVGDQNVYNEISIEDAAAAGLVNANLVARCSDKNDNATILMNDDNEKTIVCNDTSADGTPDFSHTRDVCIRLIDKGTNNETAAAVGDNRSKGKGGCGHDADAESKTTMSNKCNKVGGNNTIIQTDIATYDDNLNTCVTTPWKNQDVEANTTETKPATYTDYCDLFDRAVDGNDKIEARTLAGYVGNFHEVDVSFTNAENSFSTDESFVHGKAASVTIGLDDPNFVASDDGGNVCEAMTGRVAKNVDAMANNNDDDDASFNAVASVKSNDVAVAVDGTINDFHDSAHFVGVKNRAATAFDNNGAYVDASDDESDDLASIPADDDSHAIGCHNYMAEKIVTAINEEDDDGPMLLPPVAWQKPFATHQSALSSCQINIIADSNNEEELGVEHDNLPLWPAPTASLVQGVVEPTLVQPVLHNISDKNNDQNQYHPDMPQFLDVESDIARLLEESMHPRYNIRKVGSSNCVGGRFLRADWNYVKNNATPCLQKRFAELEKHGIKNWSLQYFVRQRQSVVAAFQRRRLEIQAEIGSCYASETDAAKVGMDEFDTATVGGSQSHNNDCDSGEAQCPRKADDIVNDKCYTYLNDIEEELARLLEESIQLSNSFKCPRLKADWNYVESKASPSLKCKIDYLRMKGRNPRMVCLYVRNAQIIKELFAKRRVEIRAEIQKTNLSNASGEGLSNASAAPQNDLMHPPTHVTNTKLTADEEELALLIEESIHLFNREKKAKWDYIEKKASNCLKAKINHYKNNSGYNHRNAMCYVRQSQHVKDAFLSRRDEIRARFLGATMSGSKGLINTLETETEPFEKRHSFEVASKVSDQSMMGSTQDASNACKSQSDVRTSQASEGNNAHSDGPSDTAQLSSNSNDSRLQSITHEKLDQQNRSTELVKNETPIIFHSAPDKGGDWECLNATEGELARLMEESSTGKYVSWAYIEENASQSLKDMIIRHKETKKMSYRSLCFYVRKSANVAFQRKRAEIRAELQALNSDTDKNPRNSLIAASEQDIGKDAGRNTLNNVEHELALLIEKSLYISKSSTSVSWIYIEENASKVLKEKMTHVMSRSKNHHVVAAYVRARAKSEFDELRLKIRTRLWNDSKAENIVLDTDIEVCRSNLVVERQDEGDQSAKNLRDDGSSCLSLSLDLNPIEEELAWLLEESMITVKKEKWQFVEAHCSASFSEFLEKKRAKGIVVRRIETFVRVTRKQAFRCRRWEIQHLLCQGHRRDETRHLLLSGTNSDIPLEGFVTPPRGACFVSVTPSPEAVADSNQVFSIQTKRNSAEMQKENADDLSQRKRARSVCFARGTEVNVASLVVCGGRSTMRWQKGLVLGSRTLCTDDDRMLYSVQFANGNICTRVFENRVFAVADDWLTFEGISANICEQDDLETTFVARDFFQLIADQIETAELNPTNGNGCQSTRGSALRSCLKNATSNAFSFYMKNISIESKQKVESLLVYLKEKAAEWERQLNEHKDHIRAYRAATLDIQDIICLSM